MHGINLLVRCCRKDPNAGQTKVLLPFMLTYFLFEVPFIVPQFLADIEPAVQAALQTVAMVHPAVALSGTMTSIVFNSAVPRIPSFHEPQHPFAWDIASRGVLFLAVEFAIFFGVLLHLESNHVMSRDPYVHLFVCRTPHRDCGLLWRWI